MANIVEEAIFNDEIYLLEVYDFVEGGENGVDNKPHKELANRTRWLKAKIDAFLSGATKVKNAILADKLANSRSISLVGEAKGMVEFDGSSDVTIEVSLNGAVGPAGAKGETGSAGARGETGAKGETGSAGAKGATGAKGETGSAGAKGETGSAGAKGATGAKGETGSAGAKGATGAKGETGSAGAKGADAVVAKSNDTNGYIKFSSGTIMQWGISLNTDASEVFPIAFPNGCFNVTMGVKDTSNSGSFSAMHISTKSWTKTGFQKYGSTSLDGSRPWIAIGY